MPDNLVEISLKEVQKNLDQIKEIKKDHKLYDMHVHPNEIIFNEYVYDQDKSIPNLYSIDGSLFFKPELSDLKIATPEQSKKLYGHLSNPRIALMMSLKKIYRHIGPEVFLQHMDLSGIDKVLLLHVSPISEHDEINCEKIYQWYGQSDRFLIACSIPSNIKKEEVKNHFSKAKEKFNIKAIKLHPNISGMDLTLQDSIDLLEEVLETANYLKLPVIIHGGKSNLINDPEHSSNAIIENFRNIDFGLTKYPVIIAHAGLYYIEAREQDATLKDLSILMDKYPNINLDIASLSIYEIEKVLNKVALEKILFGSDALYVPQWQLISTLFYLLKQKYKNFENMFIKICSLNPGENLFNEE